MASRKRLSVAAVMLTSAFGATAHAGGPLPAIAQYVEARPTSAGPVRAGDGTGAPAVPLSSRTETRLRADGGEDATALRALATEPRGAPQQRLAHPMGPREGRSVGDARDADSTPALRTFVTALDAAPSGGRRLPLLLAGLVVATAVVGLAGRRRRVFDGRVET